MALKMVEKSKDAIRPANCIYSPVIARVSEDGVKEDSSPKGDGNMLSELLLQ
mgnify:CR=1 FL=1